VRSQVRHDVDRIGDHEEDRFRCMAQHRGHDLPKHVGVSLQELQPCFARFLCHASGDDHHLGAVEVGVVAGAHREGVGEGDRMIDVVGFGLCPRAVRVHEHDLAAHPVHDERKGRRRSDHPAADDSDLHG
jgi:hypothetical protein